MARIPQAVLLLLACARWPRGSPPLRADSSRIPAGIRRLAGRLSGSPTKWGAGWRPPRSRAAWRASAVRRPPGSETTWRGFGDSRAIRPLRHPMRPEWASSARMRRAVLGRSVVRSAQCGPRPVDGRARGGCARSECATRLRPAGAVAGDARGREKESYSQTTTEHHSCGCQYTDHVTMRPYGPAIISHPPIRFSRGSLKYW